MAKLFVPAAAEAFASQADTDSNAVIYNYDADYVDRKYELLSLKVIHRRRRTGFEETKDFPIRVNDLVAGRYQVLLSAALCRLRCWIFCTAFCRSASGPQQQMSFCGLHVWCLYV